MASLLEYSTYGRIPPQLDLLDLADESQTHHIWHWFNTLIDCKLILTFTSDIYWHQRIPFFFLLPYPSPFPCKTGALYTLSILNHCMLSPGQCCWQHLSHLIWVSFLLTNPSIPTLLLFKKAQWAEVCCLPFSHQSDKKAAGPDMELLRIVEW